MRLTISKAKGNKKGRKISLNIYSIKVLENVMPLLYERYFWLLR